MADQAWVYILKCSDGSYYIGKTQNLKQRIAQHQSGAFKGYTYSRRPVEVVFTQIFSDINEAIRSERQLKGWSRKKKEALMRGDFDLLQILAECKNDIFMRVPPNRESMNRCVVVHSPFDSAQGEDSWISITFHL